MRNLKRVLSLALACVMVIGMMVMTTGAVDFDDEAEIEYAEAVAVLSAIEVLEGDDNGNFNPTDILTREQAAKIIAYMLLGPNNAEKLNANNTVFTDVAAGRWSAGYISYCTTLGILAGNGDGTFNPTGELTGVAFGKMLLVALGYDPKIERYVGSDWATNIATDMITAGIDVKGVTLSDPLTREQAAQMAFNTLSADMVHYTDKGWEMTLADGQTIIMGASDPVNYTSTNAGDYDGLYNEGATDVLQFAEKYFEDLTIDTATPDKFGNPAYTWELKGIPVVVCEEAPVATFAKETNFNAVAAALKGYVLVDDKNTSLNDTDDVVYKVNTVDEYSVGAALTDATSGKIVKTTDHDGTSTVANITVTGMGPAPKGTVATTLANLTANGRVVKVYANRDNVITAISVVTCGVSPVEKVSVNKDGDVSYKLGGVATLVDFANEEKIDEIEIEGTLAERDYAVYCFDGTTYFAYAADKFQGTQSAFNENEYTITVDGTIYDVAVDMYDAKSRADVDVDGTAGKFPNSADVANYYTDAYGNVVKSDAIPVIQYAVINKIAKVNGLSDSVEAELVFADGTTAVVPVAQLKLEDGTSTASITETSAADPSNTAHQNIICTYEIKFGKYFLTAVKTEANGSAAVNTNDDADAKVLEKGNPVVNFKTIADITTNDNTIFVVKTGTTPADIKYTAYTGYKNIPTVISDSGNAVVTDYAYARGSVAFVYVNASTAKSVIADSSKYDLVYITNDDCTTVRIDKDNTAYQYKAVINGEKGTLTTLNTTVDTGSTALTKGLYKVTMVDEKTGYATALVIQNAGNDGANNDDYKKITNLTGATDAKDGVLYVDSVTYTYDGSETVYVIDKMGNVREGSVADLDLATNAADYSMLFVKEVNNNVTTTTIHEIETVYLILK